ncbi:MAG: hypothetical protein AAFV33_24540, partial [Chloroflexota bacterium]
MVNYLEESQDAYQDKPRLIYRATADRSIYRKRVRRAVIGMLAGGGVFFMLGLPVVVNAILDLNLISIGRLAPGTFELGALVGGRVVAMLILLISAARAIVNLIRYFNRRTEEVRFYDVGFVWIRGEESHKYGWSAVKTVRENPRFFFIGKRPVLQWGEISFLMRDGETYKVTPEHGDLRGFLKRVRHYYGDEMGTRMGQRLRVNKPFKVHPELAVMPDGLVLNNEYQIGWEVLKVAVKKRQLNVAYMDGDSIKVAAKLPAHEIDNLAGFLELVEATAETFQ